MSNMDCCAQFRKWPSVIAIIAGLAIICASTWVSNTGYSLLILGFGIYIFAMGALYNRAMIWIIPLAMFGGVIYGIAMVVMK